MPHIRSYLNPRQFVEGIQDGVIGVFDRSDGSYLMTEGDGRWIITLKSINSNIYFFLILW